MHKSGENMKPFRIIFLILPAMIISYFVKTVPYNEFQGLFSCRDYYSVFSATRVKKVQVLLVYIIMKWQMTLVSFCQRQIIVQV